MGTIIKPAARFCCILWGVVLWSSWALAEPITATWQGSTANTDFSTYFLPPGLFPETRIQVDVVLDNGGNSLASQEWGPEDFVAFHLRTGDYWFRSFDRPLPPESTMGWFATDANGRLNSVPQRWHGENGNWDHQGNRLSTAEDSLGPPFGELGAWFLDGHAVDAYPDAFWPLSYSTGGSYQVVSDTSPTHVEHWSITASFAPINRMLGLTPTIDAQRNPMRSRGMLPVAIVATESLDVQDLDLHTLTLGNVSPWRQVFRDVNEDGLVDLALTVPLRDLIRAGGLNRWTRELVFRGQTTTGLTIHGTARVAAGGIPRAVPEPQSLILLICGAFGMMHRADRKGRATR